MSIKQNNANVVSTCNQRLKALGEYVKAKTQMSINGKPMKLADVIGIYQTAIDTRSELVKQRAVFDKALTARDSAENTRLATDRGLKAWVTATFGPDSQEAQEFGFLPPKIGAKTAATKATAVLKVLATRQARGTRGKRQKEKIKGTITVPTAPADPAITAPAASPPAVATAATNATPVNGAASSNGVAGSH